MASHSNGTAKKKTVLIVEDESSLLDIYTTKLVSEGYNVVSAQDGIEGLNAAIHELPDIILLDVLLPYKNGFDVLKDLKDNPKTRPIPVIILSNLCQDYEVRQGMALGAEYFLTKVNLTPALVVEELRKVLAKKRG